MSKINWFPGHMAKATKNLKTFKIVDLLIEVIDARAISFSSNNEITSLFPGKPRIKVALKSDLSSVKCGQDIIIGSIKNHGFRDVILNAIKKTLEPKINSLKKKGLVNQKFYIVVVGLPNVGKSSLINLLANRKAANVENKPGVTMANQIIKISESFFLYDTPGILFKKIETDEEGYVLSLINCIKKEIIPLEEVIEFGYKFYLKNYPLQIQKHFSFSSDLAFPEFIDHISKKYCFNGHQGSVDLNRTLNFLFTEFTLGNICKINFDEFNFK